MNISTATSATHAAWTQLRTTVPASGRGFSGAALRGIWLAADVVGRKRAAADRPYVPDSLSGVSMI